MFNSNDEELIKIINRLRNNKISIYDAVSTVSKQAKFSSALKNLLLSSREPFLRLFAAWSLGNMNLSYGNITHHLKSAYITEKDDNARANIVWALLRNMYGDVDFIKKLLYDSYFLIRLMVLKQLGNGVYFKQKIGFFDYLEKNDHPLVRMEIIKKAIFFTATEEQFVSFFQKLFLLPNFTFLNSAIIGIGNLNKRFCVPLLRNCYKKNKITILSNALIAQAFCNAMAQTTESSAHDILFEIYHYSVDANVKFSAIEALAIGGGPGAIRYLGEIVLKEKNNKLIAYIKDLLSRTKITGLDNSFRGI